MPVKALKALEQDYFKALAYSDAYYHVPITLAQFSSCRYLDPEEAEALRLYCAGHGVELS